ncbi:MAG: outer membrane protein assembly factor BamC [Acidihalobacter sp.]|jgi:outer membrane protein assembly factor BamC|uniref:outer membrane protein assembly factor BamC n=1 Tax=Acidihalobacter sp. TaxID=1872108 RepID=UPI00307F47E6
MLDAFRRAALVGAVLGLGGCSLWGGSGGYRMDATAQELQVPPQLTPPKAESTYAIPPAGSLGPEAATAQSAAEASAGGVASAATQAGVVPVVPNMQLQQAGAFRWLLVDAKPGQVWPEVLAFFKSRGFKLARSDAATGVIRTDWKINDNGLPKGFLASIINNIYASGARDRYVVRLVRGPNGTTDVYLSHQGAIKAKDSQGDMVWQWVPPNPAKEASMLQDLMVYMGAPEGKAKKLANAVTTPSRSVYALSQQDGTTVLKVALPFDQAWPQIGLGLDRVDLVVDEQDRAKGVYDVSYVGESRSNALQRLFGGGSVLNHGTKFRVEVVRESGAVTVRVLDAKGHPLSPKGTREVLNLLLSGLQ